MPAPIEPIPYDEMRRLCGLPDVRFKVVGDRWRLAFERMAAAFRSLNAATVRADDFALAADR